MNNNCHICDRADCPTLTLPFLPSVGLADCANHTVDWRARAITETARADAAEARIAILEPAVEALGELLEVSRLRGDDELPHPCDDPKLWTARAIVAWGDAQEAYAETQP